MPELPEVETLARALRPHLVGRRVLAWEAFRPRIRLPLPQALPAGVRNPTITGVARRAKVLIVSLEGPWRVLFHLGMTGRIRLVPTQTPRHRHDHLRIGLDSGLELRFNDARRFGWVRLLPGHGCVEGVPDLANLGPEPLGRSFTIAWFSDQLRRRNATIKTLLLDQRLVVGLGNIYAAEALFRAGIHPAQPGGSLAPEQIIALYRNIRTTLREAIATGSTMSVETPDTVARTPYFPITFHVYGREGKPCPQCGKAAIQRLRLGGRSSFFCPLCQPLTEE